MKKILFLFFFLFVCSCVKDESIKIKISFDSDGGEKVESIYVDKNERFELPAPEKKGYTFLYWALNDEKFDNDISDYDADITLKAVWEKNETKYVVTFDYENNQSGTSLNVNKGDKASRPKDPVKEGYTFLYWSLEGKEYDFNEVIEKDITLKAVWELNSKDYVKSNLDYTESTVHFMNPDKGFYFPVIRELGKDGINKPITKNELLNNWKKRDYSIYHLRFGLRAYSEVLGGENIPISKQALDDLADVLQMIREIDKNVIIRFAYHIDTIDDGNFTNTEPPMDLVVTHVKQVCEVMNNYLDVITTVESGFLGPWGEQHSTDSITEENLFKLIDTFVTNLKDKTVLARRPKYVMWFLNRKYNLDLTIDKINTYIPEKDSLAYRVGVYNDGYLASETDAGTFTNRDIEIEFLSNITKHTFYGGEVISARDVEGGGIGNYNNANYMIYESFLTHTAYLNYSWNYDKVIKVWEEETYNGEDLVYKNKTSNYTYIANHLGYRYILRESSIRYQNTLDLKGKIENVGFGNFINERNAYIVLKDSEGRIFYKKIDFDIRDIESKEIYIYDFKIDISDLDLNDGNYKIYFKFLDKYNTNLDSKNGIRFCNNGDIWDNDIAGNYIGEFIKE